MALSTGIVSYRKFDENTGTTVNDATGNGNTGTFNGTGTLWATGKINSGGQFNGFNSGNNYIGGLNPGINANNFSISWWSKIPTQGAWLDQWSLNSGAGNQMVCEVSNLGHSYLASIAGFAGVGSIDGGSSIWDVGWVHYVLTANTVANASILYQNGISVSSSTWGLLSFVTTDFTIGGRSGDLSRCINAVIDEVGIWSRVLSAPEVTQLYNGGVGIQYPFAATNILDMPFVTTDFKFIDEVVGY